jgi:osmotically-inducible protein OsmY
MKWNEIIQNTLLILAMIGLPYMMFGQEEKVLTDQMLMDRLETEMIYQVDVPAGKIDVTVNDGIATLEGKVPHILAKDRAAKVAMATKGIQAVVDRIQVEPVDISEEQLKSQVETALINDPVAEADELDFTINNGMVTLTGQVESWQEKFLVGRVAKGVLGVTQVVNNLEVDYERFRPDAEIQAEIEAAIQNDVRLRTSTILVDVDGAIVKMSGTVGTLAEKQIATNYGWTASVNEVIADEIEVKEWAENESIRSNEYAQKSDSEIKDAVKLAFTYDPRVISHNPEVSVKDGVVTLRGKVNNVFAKLAAADNARNVVGVIYVNNLLKVRPNVILTDANLKTRLDNLYTEDPVLQNLNISPEIQNGTVYLTGDVYTYDEKSRAERITSKIEGVEEVRNYLEVRDVFGVEQYYPYSLNYYPSPFIDPRVNVMKDMTDEQIAASIQEEWWWSPTVNSGEIEVEVEDGTAYLTGIVSSWYERRTAILDAYKGGAEKVVDRLIIDPEIN